MNQIKIKKYKNRKFYDMSTASYISHRDIILMLQNGQRFEVIDATTKIDITVETICSILSRLYTFELKAASHNLTNLCTLAKEKLAEASPAALKNFTPSLPEEVHQRLAQRNAQILEKQAELIRVGELPLEYKAGVR